MVENKVFEDRHYRVNEQVKIDGNRFGRVKEIVVPNYEYTIELEDKSIVKVSLGELK